MEKAEGGVNDVSRAGDNAAADWDGTRTPSGQLVPFGDAGAADWGIDHAIAMAKLAGAGEGELARPALCGTGLMLDRLQQLKLGQVSVRVEARKLRSAFSSTRVVAGRMSVSQGAAQCHRWNPVMAQIILDSWDVIVRKPAGNSVPTQNALGTLKHRDTPPTHLVPHTRHRRCLCPVQAPLPPSSPEARQAQNQEALRAAARAVTNLSPDVALYPDLPGLNPDPSSQRLPKQLHPGWLASKQRRPDMGALWSAAEQQHGVCGTRPMAMYERPQASSVAAVVLL